MALLTKEDILKILRIGKSTLYDLIKRGLFPKPLKIGSISRWKEEDVQAFLSSLEGTRPAE